MSNPFIDALWPEEVPILEAKDICRNELDGPEGTHCLWGWSLAAFPGIDHEVDAVVMELIGGASIPSFNFYNPPAVVASVWNRAMAKLGYTEGNPEA